MFDTYLGIV